MPGALQLSFHLARGAGGNSLRDCEGFELQHQWELHYGLPYRHFGSGPDIRAEPHASRSSRQLFDRDDHVVSERDELVVDADQFQRAGRHRKGDGELQLAGGGSIRVNENTFDDQHCTDDHR